MHFSKIAKSTKSSLANVAISFERTRYFAEFDKTHCAEKDVRLTADDNHRVHTPHSTLHVVIVDTEVYCGASSSVFSGVTCCMGDAFDGRTMHPRNTNNLKGNYMLSRPPTSTVDALSWIPAATPPSFVGKYIFVQAAATAPAKCGKTKSLIEN